MKTDKEPASSVIYVGQLPRSRIRKESDKEPNKGVLTRKLEERVPRVKNLYNAKSNCCAMSHDASEGLIQTAGVG